MHNILIIDDDFDYRQLVSTFLKKTFPDTQVTEFDPIASGIPGRNFDWSKFDCVIVDYYLCIQNFTGLDLLKREQTNPAFPASIMLTGAGNEEIAAKSLKFGANKYISKQGLTKGTL
ncbi:MAG: response regulator, partial [Gammaproteobacteria bacterium]|nr:response regulator [Gammaproteobacteria bacterium]